MANSSQNHTLIRLTLEEMARLEDSKPVCAAGEWLVLGGLQCGGQEGRWWRRKCLVWILGQESLPEPYVVHVAS